jgi:uncharacterized protein (UPF0276 family)
MSAARETLAPRALSGTGVGLRGPHVPTLLATEPEVAWFELVTDNHLAPRGPLRFQADVIAERYPVALHGVGLNLGGVDPLDRDYVDRVAALAQRLGAVHVSEHLCFTANAGRHLHELLPLPFTEECLNHLAPRIEQVQDTLGAPLLVENISTYLEFRENTMHELEFLAALVAETGCQLLLDVNNLVVNGANHGRAPTEGFDTLPWEAVAEIHVAGHEARGELLLDTHSRPVPDAVLAVLAEALRHEPHIPVLVEWDRELPDVDMLLAEAVRAEAVRSAVLGEAG